MLGMSIGVLASLWLEVIHFGVGFGYPDGSWAAGGIRRLGYQVVEEVIKVACSTAALDSERDD
jgi:hypothetical protein